MKIVVVDDPEQLADAAAHRIADVLGSPRRDRVSIGFSGGSTPVATYKQLRGLVPGWAKVDAWLSDERCVPPDDERSNGAMADSVLLGHVGASFHRPRWSPLLEPADSAAHYEAVLRSIHAGDRPDLILLGLGADGHTASLFPATEALEERRRWYVANYVPQIEEVRLTATYPLLWRAHLLMVLVSGEAKADAVTRSLGGDGPAALLDDGDAEVEWYLDAGAASLIP